MAKALQSEKSPVPGTAQETNRLAEFLSPEELRVYKQTLRSRSQEKSTDEPVMASVAARQHKPAARKH